jgi:hypothetical protein
MKQYRKFNCLVYGETKVILLPKWVNIGGVYGVRNEITVVSQNKTRGRIAQKDIY